MITRLFFFIALIVAIGGCTKKNKADYNLDISETLRINIRTEPPTLDWIKAVDTTSALIHENIMSGLAEFDYSNPELPVRPALAKEWIPSSNAKKWTIRLRDDVQWTDGVPFTAQQVLDGWEYLLNPATASQYAYFLFNIKNARLYNQGQIKDFSKVGARINKNGEIEIELEGSQSYFPYLLAHHSTYPIRKDVIEKFGDKWTEPENIQTLGPYRLKIWEHDKAIVLERNEKYFRQKAVTKYILAYMITELSTAMNLFDSGKLDIQHELPSTEMAHLKKRPEYKEAPVLVTYYYGFNVKKPPMNDPRVRQAIVHAVDRKEITQMLGGGQVPLSGWIPPGMAGYEPKVGLNFDVEKAQKLLDEAGYKDRSRFPRITLAFNTNENHQRIAENVQAQLKKNLGISVELKNEEWKVYLNNLRSNTPHIYRLGWQADYPDPDNFMNLMTSYSDNNHTGWGNKVFDQLVEQAATILDPAARLTKYSQAQALLTEKETPVLPIYSGVTHLLVSKRVKNLKLNSLDHYSFKEVELE